ncbi:restriction endonuclease subunit S [Pontibacter arcticus]|uniref:Type I restriction modification DNA specificity domain-containing protein n=1 Tax=Pontibacter arcticus TaxID=2080288 RepID=A0A364RCK1_9BACT|nr:restriction endonuclease subunit S [Pontibacter arcticus]RAU81876.1 hypothetical protein DP923_14390 [Pontibacter arcticus]
MRYRLGDICTITKGATGIMKAIPGEYPMVTLGEIDKTHNEYQFDAKAVIIPLISSTGHGHASMKRVKYQEGKFALGNILCAVIPKDESFVLAKYLQIYLHWNREELLVSQMKGMANVSLPMNRIADTEVIIPSFEAQQYIVNLERKLMAKELAAFKLIDDQLIYTEILHQAILQEAIQGKLVKQNIADEPASDLLKRIKVEKVKSGIKEKHLRPIESDDIPFDIPENWIWCKLGDIVESYQNGISTRGSNDITSAIVLRLADIKNSKVDVSDTRLINLPSKIIENHKLRKNDILITRVNGSIDLVGNFNYVGNSDKVLTPCDHFIRMRFGVLVNADFIFLVGKAQHVRKTIADNFKTTSGQKTINQGHIDNLLIPLPPLSEQNRIIAEVEKQAAKIEQLKKYVISNQQATEQLLKALLHQAFELEESQEAEVLMEV